MKWKKELSQFLDDFSVISRQAIIAIKMVACDLRPATSIEFILSSPKKDPEFPAINKVREVQLENLINTLQSFGFLVEVVLRGHAFHDPSVAYRALIGIANKQEHLQKLKDVIIHFYDQDHGIIKFRKFGEAYGIPKTAIDAFMKNESIKLDDLPQTIQEADCMQCLYFVPSKAHLREEMSFICDCHERLIKEGLLDESV